MSVRVFKIHVSMTEMSKFFGDQIRVCMAVLRSSLDGWTLFDIISFFGSHTVDGKNSIVFGYSHEILKLGLDLRIWKKLGFETNNPVGHWTVQ